MELRPQPETVAKVREFLDLVVLQNTPPTLYVRASGTVSTSGRSNGSLVPRIYTTPPADQIQEFDFVADAPRDIVLQVESPIMGEGILHELPDWSKGVRVVALGNQIEQMFPNTNDPLTDEIREEEVNRQSVGFLPPQSHVSAQSLLVSEAEGYARKSRQTKPGAEFVLGSVSVPEVKTTWETRCLLRDPVTSHCVLESEFPVIYRRVTRRRLLARIHSTSANLDLERLRACVQSAVADGIAVDVLMEGNLSVAAAALQAELRIIGKAALGMEADSLLVELRREAMSGPWKKI